MDGADPLSGAAVVGIGRTPFVRRSGRSTRAMAAEAARAALDDCGLAPNDVDGFTAYSTGDSAAPLQVAHAIGIDDLGWSASILGGGNVVASVGEKGEVGDYFRAGRATYGLRGEAGDRQVADAELALVTAGRGRTAARSSTARRHRDRRRRDLAATGTRPRHRELLGGDGGRPSIPGHTDVPYVVALVELEEQAALRLPTRLVGVDPDEMTIGQRVQVEFEPLDGGEHVLAVFRPRSPLY